MVLCQFRGNSIVVYSEIPFLMSFWGTKWRRIWKHPRLCIQIFHFVQQHVFANAQNDKASCCFCPKIDAESSLFAEMPTLLSPTFKLLCNWKLWVAGVLSPSFLSCHQSFFRQIFSVILIEAKNVWIHQLRQIVYLPNSSSTFPKTSSTFPPRNYLSVFALITSTFRLYIFKIPLRKKYFRLHDFLV